MDSLAAAPGTGPATSPMPILRKSRRPAQMSDLPTARTLIMGILNVTPDSFSDGGKHLTADTAIAAGLRMFYAGADIIDVGGESTRPGAEDVNEEEEQRRVIPVVQALVKAGALVSIDTRHTSTAAAALQAGAALINDVSGLSIEPGMPELVAHSKVPYILTHRRGDARTMTSMAEYADVVAEVVAELSALREKLLEAGVTPEQIIIDPGLGFSKNEDHNWQLLHDLDALKAMGHKVLVGASRKNFLGTLLSVSGKTAAPTERDAATAAVTAISAVKGAWAVRVHDVGPSLDAVKVAARVAAPRPKG